MSRRIHVLEILVVLSLPLDFKLDAEGIKLALSKWRELVAEARRSNQDEVVLNNAKAWLIRRRGQIYTQRCVCGEVKSFGVPKCPMCSRLERTLVNLERKIHKYEKAKELVLKAKATRLNKKIQNGHETKPPTVVREG